MVTSLLTLHTQTLCLSRVHCTSNFKWSLSAWPGASHALGQAQQARPRPGLARLLRLQEAPWVRGTWDDAGNRSRWRRVGEEIGREGSQSGEAEVRGWRVGVACSRHRVTWAGPEAGRAGPCSLCSGHRFSVTAGLGCRFWPLSPDGLGFTAECRSGRSQVFLGVVDQMNQHTSQRKVGLVGGVAAFEKPSRPPANGQEPGRPPRASTLIARVLTATECDRVAPPHLLHHHPPPPGTASAGPLLSLLPGAPEPGVSPQ